MVLRQNPWGPSWLDRLHPVKGFVYQKQQIVEDPGQPTELRIDVRARGNGVCSRCGRRGPTYDTLDERRFDVVPLWGIAVVLVYAMRRINCSRCGGEAAMPSAGRR